MESADVTLHGSSYLWQYTPHLRFNRTFRSIVPKTPTFASQIWNDDKVRTVNLGNGEFTVSGWVDAQNSFRAKIRSNWTCTLKEAAKDDWVVTGVCGLLK